jgi:Txe/YoeB family toxin of Txe-Axe toxin-antitoxin module
MKIKPLRKDLLDYLKSRNLSKKYLKAKSLFEDNIKHPSLNTELLEPTYRGIYSFRIDLKYRAIFFITGNEAEVFQITNHYKK